MGLLAPIALAALPLLAIIVALYLLKLRRPVAPVASLHLWGSLTRDREANALWQRLKVSLLLLLQLLVLLILILALARPWVRTSEAAGRHVVLVMDVSASMAATDAEERSTKSRLQAAQERAMSIIDNLPQDGTATLISSDDQASVVVPATGDRARLRAAIGNLQAQAAGTDLLPAARLAGVMAARQPNSVVWILSDGVFASLRDSVEPVPAEVRYETFGREARNQGLTALSLQPQAGSLHLFAQVSNATSVSVTRRLDFMIDDAPWTARSLTIGPGSSQELILDDVPIGARVVHAHLAGDDDLDFDDNAWVVNRSSAPANVLLVSNGNKFVELALSLLPVVTLYKVAPQDYQPSETINGLPVDLTVFDAGTYPIQGSGVGGQGLGDGDPIETPTPNPQPLSPAEGNVLIIAPQASSPLIEVTGVISDPVPTLPEVDAAGPEGQTGRDPLLRYVDLSALHISRAARMEIPAWGRVVLGSDGGPLLIAGERSGRKIGVMAFDVRDTDLPLQTAFPLLLRNLVTYLLPDPTGGLPPDVRPGEPVGVEALSPEVDRILVEDPGARELTYKLEEGSRRVAFAETAQPGVYYVSQYAGDVLAGQEAFAVNLFSRDESSIQPNASPGLPVSRPATTAGQVAGQAGEAGEQVFRRELWPLAALAALLLLLLEWGYAQRMAIRRALTERRARAMRDA